MLDPKAEPPVPVNALGRVVVTSVVSRWRGQLRVTLVAKARAAFAPGATMQLTTPAPLARRDLHVGGNPLRSVRRPGDVAPYLQHVDVSLWGSAHAPGGTPVEQMTVRLAVLDDQRPLLDKRLRVFGDRTLVDGGARVGKPAPFTHMPLVYERALGGLGSPDNPAGVGLGADAATLPNVVHDDPSRGDEVAGFAPIAALWKARRQLLDTQARAAVERPLLELPDDFTWAYFQSAPRDQQLPALPHDAWLVLSGLHAEPGPIHMRLPGARVSTRVTGPGGVAPFELRLDALFIDMDSQNVDIGYRGSFAVPDEAALAALAAEIAIHLPGDEPAWTDAPPSHAPETIPRTIPGAPLPSAAFLLATQRSPATTGGGAQPFSGMVTLDDAVLSTVRPVMVARPAGSNAATLASPVGGSTSPMASTLPSARRTAEIELEEPPTAVASPMGRARRKRAARPEVTWARPAAEPPPDTDVDPAHPKRPPKGE